MSILAKKDTKNSLAILPELNLQIFSNPLKLAPVKIQYSHR